MASIESKIKKALEYPEDTMFYVQDGRQYIGNCLLFWGRNSCGYTTDLKNAQKYTRKEISEWCKTSRETNVFWPCHILDAKISHTIDVQNLKED